MRARVKITPCEKEETRWERVKSLRLSSRVGWFSRALAFRSLYYPWGKVGTTRSLWSYIRLGYAHPHGYWIASRVDRKSYPITPIRYVTLLLRDRRGAAYHRLAWEQALLFGASEASSARTLFSRASERLLSRASRACTFHDIPKWRACSQANHRSYV